jgi:FAD synthase
VGVATRMQIYHSFAEVVPPYASVCTVGTFDGVHLGHQRLLRALIDDAHTRGIPSAVVTFFPHPRVVLGRSPALYLTLPDEKAKQLELMGLDILVVLAFTRETIQTPAAEFVRLMTERLRLTSLWIGPDFALGNKRQGDANYLREQGALGGFSVNVVSPVNAGVATVSSTRIREGLARGDLRDVNLCLGRLFQVAGAWVDCQTIQASPQHALPAPGAYPVMVCGKPNVVLVQAGAAPGLLRLERCALCDPPSHQQVMIEFVCQDRLAREDELRAGSGEGANG